MLWVQGCNRPVPVLQWHRGQIVTDSDRIKEGRLVATGDDPHCLEKREQC